MACLLVEAGFTGWAVEGHREHGHRTKVSDSAWDPHLSVAVTETVSVVPPSGGSVVAVAENVAVGDPAGTFTEVGTVNAGLLAETDTLMPPVEAGTERVRVQVEDAPASSMVALHVNADTSTGAIRLKVAVWEALLSVAVMLAFCVVLTAPALAVKLALLAPLDTVTEVGIVRLALLLAKVTAVLEGAA